MVKFKIFDTLQKKYIGLPTKIWDSRYKLGIWSNTIMDNKVEELYNMMKDIKHLQLQIKINGRFKPVTKEVIEQHKKISKTYKKKSTNKKTQKNNWWPFA
jgi:hypothetical protein